MGLIWKFPTLGQRMLSLYWIRMDVWDVMEALVDLDLQKLEKHVVSLSTLAMTADALRITSVGMLTSDKEVWQSLTSSGEAFRK